MKTGARLPRGIRWLGLMALGGVSLAVQAEEKIVLLTSWYAQAEQGGYYQAQATGLYKKYGLDVEIPPVDRRSTACSCCCRSGPM
ncbi:hydroxymethylpyrimidine ABC transporter substrate-binding protein [Klebsiella pneumoniae]|uniref:Hydroxymethylpyrimidine ABC transporter substrate-binding protein n=1 Tax=Klebsiella pneumoniae TaxID=573 RepID=A0A378F7B0_KLEPN|nr:hydroxymethylpyrimidine ABC transporter substrate-binding protein [Klebsiella pneumoniae]